MGFTIQRIAKDADLEELVQVELKSFHEPHLPFIDFLFPDAREATQRQAIWYQMDPSAVWLKAIDDSGKIVGATLWNLYEQNPYANFRNLDCTWLEEGETRVIGNDLMAQLMLGRRTYMPKPHVFLNICFTAPDARRQGIGAAFMDWGVKEADKRGVESFVEATGLGKALYSRYGFIEGPSGQWTTVQHQRSSKLEELETKWGPTTWTPMYRPIGGAFEPGKTRLPWSS